MPDTKEIDSKDVIIQDLERKNNDLALIIKQLEQQIEDLLKSKNELITELEKK